MLAAGHPMGIMGKATCEWHGLEWKGMEQTALKELAEVWL